MIDSAARPKPEHLYDPHLGGGSTSPQTQRMVMHQLRAAGQPHLPKPSFAIKCAEGEF